MAEKRPRSAGSRPASAGRTRTANAPGAVIAAPLNLPEVPESNGTSLDAANFDPMQYLPLIFPNHNSNSEAVLNRLKQKLQDMDLEITTLVTKQADKAANHTDFTSEFNDSKENIAILFEKIRRIREKAAASEQLVQDITREITSLDHAKQNLMLSMATIKKLQMLASSLDYIRVILAKKEYADVAQLLEVILKLGSNFESFRNVAQVAVLLERVAQVKVDVRRQIFAEFEAAFVGGAFRSVVRQLTESCFAVRVLGADVLNDLINWYCDTQLKDYKAIFRQNPEIASLDAVGRRYAWLKRLLKTHDEEHAVVFPEDWQVSEFLCERFCADTKKDISDVLVQTESSIDVKVMLTAIQQTIEFEGKVAGRFSVKNFSDDSEEISTGTTPSKFKGIISCCFEPYLRLYIDSEDKNLSSMMDGYRSSLEYEDEEYVLSSSTDLFLFYRQTLVQFSKLTTNKPFLDLCRLFAKWLKAFSDILAVKLPKEDKKSYSDEDLKTACLVINTADYCSQTAAQLEEKLIDRIDERYKSSISFTAEIEAFVSVTGLGVKSLTAIVEASADPAITIMLKRPWGTMDSVGDQSEYITQIGMSIASSVGLMKRYVSAQKYLKTFYDKFSESFLNKFYTNIFRCRPISEVGAEQLLLDTHALKTILIQMTQQPQPSGAGTALSPDTITFSSPGPTGPDGSGMSGTSASSATKVPPPAAFLKILGKGVLKIEQLLKVVLRTHEPASGIVETYVLLFPDGDANAFQKILELKGLKRSEQQPILDAYLQRVGKAVMEPTGKENSAGGGGISSKFKLGKWGLK